MVGQRARLPCTVLNLDKRDAATVKVFHPEDSNEWHLDISSVTFRDAGVYECQVSSSPKIHLPIHLHVQVQQARVQGPSEVFLQEGSTIKLTCIVNTREEDQGSLAWYRGNTELDYDSPRGGVSVEIEKTPTRTTSKLFLTRAAKADSGNYTCAPHDAQPATVHVHVVRALVLVCAAAAGTQVTPDLAEATPARPRTDRRPSRHFLAPASPQTGSIRQRDSSEEVHLD
ncbi:hypothetical protein O3P69_005875 [Scylla paramamosain]|uniref:Ig-like domain-containing protein n=1 Tax=Scylla paramamosain TaxID=85552 RepID=A0AAW0U3P8_SCYPA